MSCRAVRRNRPRRVKVIEIHMDPLGGIAGDMFVAALLHLRPDLEKGLARTIALCPLIEDVDVEFPQHGDGVLTGRRFVVRRRAEVEDTQDRRHPAGHGGHGHVDWRVIREALTTSRLDPKTVGHAVAIFRFWRRRRRGSMASTPRDVRFHEVGAWDSIADIVAAAWLIGEIDAGALDGRAAPLGSGRIRSAHGLLPAPAPATAFLLEGFSTIDDGIGGERVTPTGAAILRHLCKPAEEAREPRRLAGSGYGFGAKRLPGVSNCLRVLAFETLDAHAREQDRRP